MTRCIYFKDCGGCSYLDLDEEKYHKIKSQKLFETLDSCGFSPDEKNFSIKWIEPKRRKATLQIDEENNLGFFAFESKKLVKIESCYVLESALSELILALQKLVKNFEKNLLTQIQITLFDNVIDVVFCAKRQFNSSQNKKISDFAESLKINASSLVQKKFSPISISKNPFLKIEQTQIDLKLSSQIFIQATKTGLEEIIDLIRAEISQMKKPKIVDIYSGFGVYSFAIFDLAKEIHTFEGSVEMVDLIALNAASLKLSNKIKAQNRDLFSFPVSWLELKEFDAAIINPPRNGASPQVKEISDSKLKKLIYVSCSPQSFARDALILKGGGFRISHIVAVDQFYSTDHFELVAVFERA